MGAARGAEWALPSRSLWPQGEHGVSTGPVLWPAGGGGGRNYVEPCLREEPESPQQRPFWGTAEMQSHQRRDSPSHSARLGLSFP